MELPGRLWARLVKATGIDANQKWADTTKEQIQVLAKQLTEGSFKVEGKSTFKEEFVTAGGVDLKEINFKTFESKILPNLYLAGEIINVDAVTGGFNFQNAWTGAYIAAQAIAKN
ncbi:MAG: NAD(P)/FAD-dependent oxidoreductase [Bacteroidota bacterium]